MITKDNKKGAYNVVEILNLIGYIVVEIDNRFYTTKSFEEASNGSWKHSLEGKDVTNVIESYLHINPNDRNYNAEIIGKIDSLRDLKKFFHKDFKFILHLK